MAIRLVNKVTGEELAYKASGDAGIVETWGILKAWQKSLETALEGLREQVLARDLDGQEVNGRMFRVIQNQRTNYDLSVMRAVLDEDLVNDLIKPDKRRVDTWLKEAIEKEQIDQGIAKELRSSMLPDGNPYVTVRLERLTSDTPTRL